MKWKKIGHYKTQAYPKRGSTNRECKEALHAKGSRKGNQSFYKYNDSYLVANRGYNQGEGGLGKLHMILFYTFKIKSPICLVMNLRYG